MLLDTSHLLGISPCSVAQPLGSYLLFEMVNYNVDFLKGRVYTDTCLDLEGKALIGYPYSEVKKSL